MRETECRQVLNVPEGLRETITKKLDILDEPLRISFVAGPGDVVGTYAYWRDGEQDPRIPSITYSWQIYELTKQIEASLQVVTPFSPPENTEGHVQFTEVKRQPWQGRLGYYKSSHTYVRDVAAQVNAFAPHIVIVGTDFPPSGWKMLKKGRMLVLTAHNTFWTMGHKPSGLKATVRMKLLESYSKALDGAVCTSQECARQLDLLTNGRIKGRAQYPQIVARYPLEERQQVRKLLYIGRIEANKGIFMLLDTFVALQKEYPDLDLTFAGSGGADGELYAAINATGLANVRFLGRLDSTQVHNAISETDLIVCPTMSDFPEGLAVVGLEAAAHGIPTLLSSVVPAIELLGPACKSFQVDDAEDFSRVLSGLISDTEAYAKLLENVSLTRPRLYDPSLSWGSQLALVLQDL